MNDVGTIRKTVGKPLEDLSPFQRLERLRQNAKPFTQNPSYLDNKNRIIIRKTVGASGQS